MVLGVLPLTVDAYKRLRLSLAKQKLLSNLVSLILLYLDLKIQLALLLEQIGLLRLQLQKYFSQILYNIDMENLLVLSMNLPNALATKFEFLLKTYRPT